MVEHSPGGAPWYLNPLIWLLATMVGAASVWIVNQYLPRLWQKVPGIEAVSVRVETDPAVFQADVPVGWTSYEYVIPGPRADIGPPPGDFCRLRHSWARGLGGVDARRTKIYFTVEGRSEGQVFLDRIRIKVLRRGASVQGTHIACPVGGAEGVVRGVRAQLDRDPPRVRYIDDPDGVKTKPFVFTLSKGEVEGFDLEAAANDCYCEWVVELSYVANGQRETFEVTDAGQPFRTTGTARADSYLWDGARYKPGSSF